MRDNISAVMIVKNEEANLERCLDSLKDVMPAVIVDTGSSDRTMEIAKDYGTELHEHPWQDSFSEARNYALGYVKTDWALQIDADEELVGITEPALDSLSLDYAAYLTPIHNLLPNGAAGLHHFERIYQPGKVHYKWRVHNELIAEGKIGITSLSIRHYGYALSDEEMQEKYERTLKLVEMELEETGYTLRTVRYLIQQNRVLNRYDEVIKIIENHIHVLDEFPGPYQEAAAAAIVAYNGVGENAKAKVAGIQLLDEFPEALDALFYLGVAYMEDQAWDLSMECMARYIKVRTALQLEGTDSSMIYHTWGNRPDAFQNIGICASMLGNKPQAALFFMRAEMLAKHRTDIAGFAANTDNSLCLLLHEKQGQNKPGEIVKLTLPDGASPADASLEPPVPSISGSGVVISKE